MRRFESDKPSESDTKAAQGGPVLAAGRQRDDGAQRVAALERGQRSLPPRLAVVTEPELERALVGLEPDVDALGRLERLERAVQLMDRESLAQKTAVR